MKHTIRNSLSGCTLAALLSACAGGGSFNTLAINTEPPPLPEPPAVDKVPEPRQSPEEQDALKKPALGYVMPGLRRNQAKYDAEGNPLLDDKGQPTEAELRVDLDPQSIEAVTDDALSLPKLAELQAKHPREPISTPRRSYMDQYQYIRFGHIAVRFPDFIEKGRYPKLYEYREGHDVYTFYRGIHASPALPLGDSVNYNGQWSFLSNVSKGKGKTGDGFYGAQNNFNDEVGDGDIASATDDERTGATNPLYKSSFTVNFTDKKLAGTLSYAEGRTDERQERPLYRIAADIKGNRFTGKATSAVNNQSSVEDKGFFYADANHLEGGFYGPQGEELAGRFLTNDNSLFGVFGARREGAAETETLFDAVYIASVPRQQMDLEEQEVEPKPLTNFNFAQTLRFGGHTFQLDQQADWSPGSRSATLVVSQNDDGTSKESIHLCCSNLSYLRFGSFKLAEKAGKAPTHALFLQGERTPVANMPTSGRVQYTGTWSGFVQTATLEYNPYRQNDFHQTADMSNLSDNGPVANRAEFDVDFDQKSLQGKLIAHNSHVLFNINADIQGNGFSGTAATPNGGFSFDPGSSTGGRVVQIANAEVKGGFYGPDARELGGSVHYNRDAYDDNELTIRAGAVFGAVRQD